MKTVNRFVFGENLSEMDDKTFRRHCETFIRLQNAVHDESERITDELEARIISNAGVQLDIYVDPDTSN